MVETADPAMVDRIIAAAHGPSGAYTPSAADHGEMWAWSPRCQRPKPRPDLPRLGQHLFGRFVCFPFFSGVTSAFDFLAGLNGIIHVEVRKLYPDAELPHFEVLGQRSSAWSWCTNRPATSPIWPKGSSWAVPSTSVSAWLWPART
jgi:hypothetical protein